MRHSRSETAVTAVALLIALAAALPRPATAQRRPPPPRPVPRIESTQGLASMMLEGPAPMPGWPASGAESAAMRAAGWTIDSLGNAVLRAGSGSPRRVVACGADGRVRGGVAAAPAAAFSLHLPDDASLAAEIDALFPA